MAIQTLYDNGEDYQIDSKYDGAVYAAAAPDCVCEGIGDQFKLNYSSSSLTAYFDAGSEAVIGGSFFKLTSRHTLEGNNQLPNNSTFYLCARIDLNNPNGQRGTFVYIPDLSNAQKGNLNGSGTQRDLPLYKITTGSSGVTTCESVMVVRSADSTSFSGIYLKIISEADYNALATKDANTLYFIPEK